MLTFSQYRALGAHFFVSSIAVKVLKIILGKDEILNYDSVMLGNPNQDALLAHYDSIQRRINLKNLIYPSFKKDLLDTLSLIPGMLISNYFNLDKNKYLNFLGTIVLTSQLSDFLGEYLVSPILKKFFNIENTHKLKFFKSLDLTENSNIDESLSIINNMNALELPNFKDFITNSTLIINTFSLIGVFTKMYFDSKVENTGQSLQL